MQCTFAAPPGALRARSAGARSHSIRHGRVWKCTTTIPTMPPSISVSTHETSEAKPYLSDPPSAYTAVPVLSAAQRAEILRGVVFRARERAERIRKDSEKKAGLWEAEMAALRTPPAPIPTQPVERPLRENAHELAQDTSATRADGESSGMLTVMDNVREAAKSVASLLGIGAQEKRSEKNKTKVEKDLTETKNGGTAANAVATTNAAGTANASQAQNVASSLESLHVPQDVGDEVADVGNGTSAVAPETKTVVMEVPTSAAPEVETAQKQKIGLGEEKSVGTVESKASVGTAAVSSPKGFSTKSNSTAGKNRKRSNAKATKANGAAAKSAVTQPVAVPETQPVPQPVPQPVSQPETEPEPERTLASFGEALLDAIVEGVETCDEKKAVDGEMELVQLVDSGKINKLTVTKLRRLLSAAGLKTSGRKAELIERLCVHARSLSM